jgi:hypothetical protein
MTRASATQIGAIIDRSLYGGRHDRPFFGDEFVGQREAVEISALSAHLGLQSLLHSPRTLSRDVRQSEPDGAGLLPGQDGGLPLPDASAAEARWAAVRSRFDPAVRYLDGEPFTPQRLVEAFRSASMRRRS